MCLAQGVQRSDAGEARARNTSVSSQALYRWATALPTTCLVNSAALFASKSKINLQRKKYIFWGTGDFSINTNALNTLKYFKNAPPA